MSAAANGAISLSSISPPHNGSKHFFIAKKVFPNISQKLYHYSQKGASPPKLEFTHFLASTDQALAKAADF